MIKYMESFCTEIHFPEEGKKALIEDYLKLEKKRESILKFQELVIFFQIHNEKEEYPGIFSRLDEIANQVAVHKYSLHMIYLIALSIQTRKLYEDRNISYEIYVDSMSDLRYKLMECYELHEIWGTASAWWEIDFFNLNLIALGRLQYETMEYKGEYSNGIHTLKEGDMVLNMHIPSGRPLLIEDCQESFRKATIFYQDYFKGMPIPFVCYSWLLYPKHREFLPKESNILKFMSFFDIISSVESEEKSDMWRVFYKDWKKEAKDLPRNTSIQRAYADWLLQGNPIGEGHGVFFLESYGD